MYPYEDRMRAVQLYIKYGKRTMAVIRELGYPSRKNLLRWYRAYVEAGDLPKRSRPKPRYTTEQKRAAVEHYVDHGCCLATTCRILGYPRYGVLGSWVDELCPGRRRLLTSKTISALFASEQKQHAASDLCDRQGSAREVAEHIGVSRAMLYKWKDRFLVMRHNDPCANATRSPLRMNALFCLNALHSWNSRCIVYNLSTTS